MYKKHMKHNESHNLKKSIEIIYNLWLCVDIRPSSHQVLEFWSSAAEAAACKCAAAGLSPAFRGVPDYINVVPEVMPTLCKEKEKNAWPKAQLYLFLFSV